MLNILVTSVVRNIRPALKPGVSLETSLDLNLPSSALGDPLRYRQVVQNLISNAVKFTESGSIDVHVSLVDEDATSFIIRTEVTDTGIGIQKVAVESLFSPFTQFDASATKRYKGTGLGLSICKSLAELSMHILEFNSPYLNTSRVRDISIIPLPNISGVANWRFSSQAMLTRDYPVGGAIGFHPTPKDQGSVFWFTSRLRKIDKSKQVDRLSAKLEATALSPVLDSLTLVRELAPGKRLLLAEDNLINQKVML